MFSDISNESEICKVCLVEIEGIFNHKVIIFDTKLFIQVRMLVMIIAIYLYLDVTFVAFFHAVTVRVNIKWLIAYSDRLSKSGSKQEQFEHPVSYPFIFYYSLYCSLVAKILKKKSRTDFE